MQSRAPSWRVRRGHFSAMLGDVWRNPVDVLRTRLTRGLEVKASTDEVFRGDELDAVVTILSPRDLGDVEVGLVCTEAYSTQMTTSDGTSEGQSWATAYETWVSVEGVPGSRTVRLRVPADAPFSYEGELLAFTWEVVARGVRKRRLDARATYRIHVRP